MVTIELLDAKETGFRLKKLIKKHEKISIAVAWGACAPVGEELLRHKAKFREVIVGVNAAFSDPDFIDGLIGVRNAYVAKEKKGIFHPKIYYFQTGGQVEVVVGSSNFTNGGLTKNTEANILLRGCDDDEIFKNISNKISEYASLGHPVTQKIADLYRRHVDVQKKKARVKDPVLPGEKTWGAVTSELATMSWQEFYDLAKRDENHDFTKRLCLIRKVQIMFSGNRQFSDFSISERRGVAGILGHAEAKKNGLGEYDWGWFGWMQQALGLPGVIEKPETEISLALDCIPLGEEVTRDQYDEFVKIYKKALSPSPNGNPIATATRFLAMKRPDQFVCVTTANRKKLAHRLGYSWSTLTLDNYWDRIVEPVRQAPWYNAAAPKGTQKRALWSARVAMLDAICYAS